MQIMFYFQPRRGLFMPFIAMDDIILKCFNDGFSYLEIVELLNHVRDFQITSSNLKRWLKDNRAYFEIRHHFH